MHRTFHSANVDEFQDIVASYPFTRRITEVHLHHTWKPRQRDYRGLATIEAMWRHHTGVNGWDDIAQHVTVAPDGAIWLCRNFNWSPASARGFNGNRDAGPFMIEMIGDFDAGQEQATEAQTQSVLAVVKTVQRRFGLDAHAIRFHSEMSDKSCPGRGIDKRWWVERIDRHELRARRSRGDAPLFPEHTSRYWELMREMNPDAEQRDEMLDAEHEVGVGHGSVAGAAPEARGGSGAAGALDDETLDTLADHVINLERGQLSDTGRIETTAADVDRLFEELVPREIDAARAAGRPARLLFYAHGGLVSEGNALAAAATQLGFWRANDVYPVFFVWETGFAETVRQLVAGAGERVRGARGPIDWFTDRVSDNLIEEIARVAGGRTIWGGMKSSAALASAAGGGATRVAKRLRSLVKEHGDDLDIHLAGHSAGSIFHAHFVAELARRRVPVRTMHYLAPAISNALFHDTVAPLLGDEVGHLTLYTMTKRREKRDKVTPLYRKSLLYLVHEAFERKRRTPILGLEESLREDRAARELFGLHGSGSDRAEVIWSPSEDSGSGNSSAALTHAGFDDDAATMQSVVRRVLGRRDGEPIAPFPSGASRGERDFWGGQFEWPSGLEGFAAGAGAFAPPGTAGVGAPLADGGAAGGVGPNAGAGAGGSLGGGTGGGPVPGATTAAGADPFAGAAPERPSGGAAGGAGSERRSSRRALCIGIDAYARQPLAGCVADAKLWKRTLEGLGYDVELLVDREATAERILAEVTTLVRSGRRGDHLVLQFAGHGTQFDDLDHDESDGDTPTKDECLCAVDCDFAAGGLVIDDELRVVIDTLAEGASLTCFFDCCHSGSASRMVQRRSAGEPAARDVRSRYLAPSEAMRRAYRDRARRLLPGSSRGPTVQRDVLFSACRSSELAFESDGQGDFTRHATRLIGEGIGGLENRDFLERVLAAFGDASRQTPEIHCEPSARAHRFLGLDDGAGAPSPGGAGAAAAAGARPPESA